MKVYVINLDKNSDRLRLIDERLRAFGVPFKRIEAIYGKDLTESEKRRSVSRFKWWCVRGTLPRDGEIGCALSNQRVYRKLLESGDGCCCVLEDDDQFDPRFKAQLERIEKWVEPSRSQVVLMTNYTKEKSGDEWAVKPTHGDSSTEAYVITRAAAKALLNHCTPIHMPSDGWRYWVKRGWIELYHAFPTVVPCTWQLPGYTSDVCPTGEKMVRVSEMGAIKKVLWKLQRVAGLLLARFII